MLEARLEAEFNLRFAVQAAYLDVAKTTIDRMLRRAEALGKGAAAIGTVYSSVLGLNFAAGGPKLPAVALLPTAFFAIAVFFVAINLGWVTRSQSVGRPLRWGTSPVVQHARMAEFVSWVNTTAIGRAWALRTAIVSLALGVFTSPIAFVEIDAKLVFCVAVLFLVAWLLGELVRSLVSRSAQGGHT